MVRQKLQVRVTDDSESLRVMCENSIDKKTVDQILRDGLYFQFSLSISKLG